MIDVNIMVTNNETTINKDESELVAVDDVKLNDDDETDEIEDIISAFYKTANIKFEGEVVEFDPERNVSSSSFVPKRQTVDQLLISPHANRKTRISLANEANASRAKRKAKASLSQLFSNISSKPNAVQREVYESITKFSRDTMRSIKNPRVRQTYR